MKGANAGIVAFTFGIPSTLPSNRRIAQIASTKARELNNAPVYTQLLIQVEPGIPVNYTEEKLGNFPPTLRIARGAVQWAKQRKLTQLWIVAAKPHLWRALRDVRQTIRENKVQIEIHACQEIEQCPEDSWFCPDSTQERIRSRRDWNKRERILRLMPFFVYKLVAS